MKSHQPVADRLRDSLVALRLLKHGGCVLRIHQDGVEKSVDGMGEDANQFLYGLTKACMT